MLLWSCQIATMNSAIEKLVLVTTNNSIVDSENLPDAVVAEDVAKNQTTAKIVVFAENYCSNIDYLAN